MSRPRREPWRTLLGSFDPTAILGLATAVALVTAGSISAALAPLALKTLVDRLTVVTEEDGSTLRLVALYVGALLLQRACEQGQAYAYGRGEQRLIRRFAAQAFLHLLALPLNLHLKVRSGALAHTLSEGVLGLRLILTHAVVTVLPVVIQLAVAGVVLASVFGPRTRWVLTAALCAYAMVFTVGVWRLGQPMRGISAATIDAGGAVGDSLMNIEAIKAFAVEPRFAARYDRILARGEIQARHFLRRRLGTGLAVMVIFSASLAATLANGAGEVRTGGLSVGGLVLLNAYLLQIIRPLEQLGFAVRDIGQGLAHLSKLSSLLKDVAEPPSQAPPKPVAAARPADLVFDDVSFSFGPDRPTLRQISFHLRPGAMVAIVGPSGAGKSAILRLILRFFEPDAGTIRLDGTVLASLGLAELRGQIALVGQDTILLNDTIGGNIALGDAQADRSKIEQAAAAAQLGGLLAQLPAGLDTPVGERGLKLSGGEKQRIALARAVLRRGRLIVFDEATAALDAETEQAVWRAMLELARGATTLVVTHRLSTVTQADEILVLDRGRIVERGRHGALLTQGGLYARLWAAQSRLPGSGGPEGVHRSADGVIG